MTDMNKNHPGKPESDNNRQNNHQKTLGFLVNTLLMVIIGIVLLLAWNRLQGDNNQTAREDRSSNTTNPQNSSATSSPGRSSAQIDLSPFATTDPLESGVGVSRSADIHTNIPTRPRVDVITYTVQGGDNLFNIAETHGLKAETVLWGNFDVLQDNPHFLQVDQVLRILPVDGAYYQWSEGDTLSSVANFFGVEPQDILEYPGNLVDLSATSIDDPGFEPGDGLIVPGGEREPQDWGPPQITRDNPALAAYYGAGTCGSVYTGVVGTGTFAWPTDSHFITYGYDAVIHRAIDIGGVVGSPLYATDSGVVVFAGGSNYGYGNLVVLDHGNGWQSAYAHMDVISVNCGESVFQGSTIGTIGLTGNTTGPHLHFETVYLGTKPNPLNVLQ